MDYQEERRQALEAGRRALDSLERAKEQLGKARSWGIVDILGGHGLVTLIKQMKVEAARRNLDQARYDLMSFGRELEDIHLDLNINIGDLLTIFDFYDNFFADVLVQNWIVQAQDKIQYAIDVVQDALRHI